MENKPEMFDAFYTVNEVIAGLEKEEQLKKSKMQVIDSELVIPFDVDDTLVIWGEFSTPLSGIKIVDPYDGNSVFLTPHKQHIKLLKNYHARGAKIIVWSQNGNPWAEAVVKALGLEEYVTLVMTKPRAYVDDLPISEWLSERIYIKPTSNWGHTK